MKKLLYALFAILVLAGCERQIKDPEPRLEIGPEQPTRYTVPYTGGTYEVVFTSATKWQTEVVYAREQRGWVRLDRSAGSGGEDAERIVVTVDENTIEDLREADLQLISGPHIIHIHFSQERANPENPEDSDFYVDDRTIELDAVGGEISIAVRTKLEYEHEVNCDWISDRGVSIEEETVYHKFYVSENAGDSRQGTITFYTDKTRIPVTVNQKGKVVSELQISRQTISVEASGTTTPLAVNVTSNTTWFVRSNAAWCIVDVDSGRNNGTFHVTVESNRTREPRYADITVETEDRSVSRTLSVMQAPSTDESEDPENPGEDVDDTWQSKEFFHRSLVMHFTSDQNGDSPQIVEAIEEAHKILPDKFELVNVYIDGDSFVSDEILQLAHQSGASYYKVQVDVMANINYNEDMTGNIVSAVMENESDQVATSASWTSSVADGSINLDMSVYMKKQNDYFVTALLLEDNIVAPQKDTQDGEISNYIHSGVVRTAFTSPLGDMCSVDEDNVVKTFSYSVKIPEGCKTENLRILVFILEYSSEKGCYMVDNTITSPVGVEKPLGMVGSHWGDGTEGIVPGDDIIL